jgi:hypothetical protein
MNLLKIKENIKEKKLGLIISLAIALSAAVLGSYIAWIMAIGIIYIVLTNN